MTTELVPTGTVTVCCSSHCAEGCCDTNDCGPCCPECPTCPTVQSWTQEKRREVAAGQRALLAELFCTPQQVVVHHRGDSE